jgi:hypothetical protein
LNNITENEVTRQNFLKYGAAVGAGLGMVYLAACKKKADDEEELAEEPAAAGGECSDASALPPEDQQLRENMVGQLQYVEQSTVAGKNCLNCQFYIEGSPCGGCTLIKGPIAPEGYCNSWAAKPA